MSESAAAMKYGHLSSLVSEPYGRYVTVHDQVIYEQPLNEKTRTFLRLEFLFEQTRAHTFRHSLWDSRAALSALFDLVNVFTRADIKTEILKELERQANYLERLAENPDIDQSRLDEVLGEMDLLIDRLHTLHTHDLDLRDNEFLTAIKQRASIAGGSCDFDLPVLHYWLSQPEEKRILDLQKWLEPFDVIHQSINLILRLIRDSAFSTKEVAEGGFYQKSLDTSHSCQLIRISLPGDMRYYPEVSGSKHRFTIRFMKPSFSDRPSQTDNDIPFELSCCTL